MFIPSEFAETRLDEIKAIVTQFPLATIVAVTDQGLVANHLPVLVDTPLDAIGAGRGTISGRGVLLAICPAATACIKLSVTAPRF